MISTPMELIKLCPNPRQQLENRMSGLINELTERVLHEWRELFEYISLALVDGTCSALSA